MNPIMIAKANPPAKPSQVLLGDTFSYSLCLPKIFPDKYANVSFVHTNKKTPKIMGTAPVSFI